MTLTNSVLRMATGICSGEVTGGFNKSNFRGSMGMKALVRAGSTENGKR